MPPTCPFGISRQCKPPCPGPPWTIFCQTPAVYCRQLRSPQAAHVHVPHSKLLSCQTLTAADLELHCSGGSEEDGGEAASRHMRRLAGAGLALLHQLLGALGALGPGRYLLAHAPGEPTCCLFKALSEEAAEAVEVTGRGAGGMWGAQQRRRIERALQTQRRRLAGIGGLLCSTVQGAASVMPQAGRPHHLQARTTGR